MFKSVILFIFIPTLTFGAQITVAQAQQARNAAAQADYYATSIARFADQVLPYLNNGFQFSVAFSTNTITLSAQQQADIISYYQTLKAGLQQAVNNLP